MKNNTCTQYIIKQSTGSVLRFSYDKLNGIIYETLELEKWSDKKTVYKNSTPNFYVLLKDNDEIYILCEDNSGNIVLCTYNDNQWNNDIILYRKENSTYNFYFKAILHNNDIHLIYNILSKSSKAEALVHQIYYQCKTWSSPNLIDVITPLPSNPFLVLNDQSENILVIYQNYKQHYQINLKKFSIAENTWGNSFLISKNTFQYIDLSSICALNTLHCIYIKKDKFYSKVIYQNKGSSEKKEIQLFEGNNIKSCSLFMIDEHLWVLWFCDNKIYSCFSTDNGKFFSSPVIYNQTLDKLAKINYQTTFPEEKLHLTVNELYLDENYEFKILFIPDLFPSITNIDINCFEDSLEVSTNTVDSHIKYIKSHLNEVYEKIYLCKKQITEKDQKIHQLNYTLEYRNNEIIKYEHSLKVYSEKNRLLSEENERLKKRILILEQNLSSKENELSSLKAIESSSKNELEILKSKLTNHPTIENTIQSTHTNSANISNNNNTNIGTNDSNITDSDVTDSNITEKPYISFLKRIFEGNK